MRYLLLAVISLSIGCSSDRPVILPTGSSLSTLTYPPNVVMARKTYSREKFKELVLGKTEEDVIKVVGKPDKKIDGTNELSWLYFDTTKEPGTSKVDSFATVYFKAGIVDRVDY